ncbi:hypothetical protein JG688_00010531, partial [Phytophthora aleatoria]
PLSFLVVVVVPTKSEPGNYRYGSGFYGAFVFRVICLNGTMRFLLLAFDFLALRSAWRELYIRLKVSTAALVAGNISRETIRQAVKYYNHLTESQAHGVQPTPPPDAIK